MFWPFLTRFGYGITLKKIFVMSFSNFRGIWVLIMALTTFSNKGLSVRLRELGIFYGACFLFVSWLANGLTTK